MRCHQAISAAGAVSTPWQQRSAPSATGTKGTVLARLMVRGNWRARRNPAQNGHRHRVAPSVSGAAWRAMRQRARRLNLASYVSFSASLAPRGGAGRSRSSSGRRLEKSWPSINRASPENGTGPALVGDGLEGLVDAGLGQLVVDAAGLAQAVARVPDDVF